MRTARNRLVEITRIVWAAFSVVGPHHRVFFSGDTGPTAEHADFLEAQGFVQEGRLRAEFYREGTYHDIVVLSIFRDGAPQETK